MIATQKTRLSVTYVDTGDNNTVKYVREMADTDVETFEFDAGQAIVSATASLTRLPGMEDDSALIANVAVESPDVRATVAGLVRGRTYELAVVFTNAAGRTWTRTLVLKCVA